MKIQDVTKWRVQSGIAFAINPYDIFTEFKLWKEFELFSSEHFNMPDTNAIDGIYASDQFEITIGNFLKIKNPELTIKPKQPFFKKLFNNKMKTLTILIMTAMLFASCSKSQDNNPEPIKASTKVSYYVECSYCSVYVEDNVWNRNNHVDGRPDAVSQHFNVSGHWSYEFEAKGIDTVSIKIVGNSYAETGLVYARVSQDGNQKHFSGFLSPEKGNEAFIELAIKK